MSLFAIPRALYTLGLNAFEAVLFCLDHSMAAGKLWNETSGRVADAFTPPGHTPPPVAGYPGFKRSNVDDAQQLADERAIQCWHGPDCDGSYYGCEQQKPPADGAAGDPGPVAGEGPAAGIQTGNVAPAAGQLTCDGWTINGRCLYCGATREYVAMSSGCVGPLCPHKSSAAPQNPGHTVLAAESPSGPELRALSPEGQLTRDELMDAARAARWRARSFGPSGASCWDALAARLENAAIAAPK